MTQHNDGGSAFPRLTAAMRQRLEEFCAVYEADFDSEEGEKGELAKDAAALRMLLDWYDARAARNKPEGGEK